MQDLKKKSSYMKIKSMMREQVFNSNSPIYM